MKKRDRICLITPGHLATNPRIVKEADALSGAGYRVSVIAADYLDWASKADEEFAGRPWQPVHKIPFGPRSPKASYLWQTLRRHAARKFVEQVGPRVSALERAIHSITPELTSAASRVPAELYIAHYVAALPAAARAAAWHGAKFGFDAEDFHCGDYPDDERHAFDRELIQQIEGRYLPLCQHLTAASPGIADAYAQRYGTRRPTVILNVFPRSHAPPAPTPRGTARPGPSLYWFSQTIGPNRGLECAVQAIALAQSRPHLYLRGNMMPGYLERLQRLAREGGVSGRIHFLAPESPRDMERLAAAYDVGLVSEVGETKNRRIALTNKLFSYLLAGLPVAATKIAAHAELSGDTEGAVFLYATNDASALATVLDKLLLNPDKLAEARSRAWDLGKSRFNWDVEQKALLESVAGQLAQ